LETCRIFEAKVDQKTVGSIYAMKYMYGCGWIGGLLVHKEFRRKGVSRKLLEKAVGWLDTSYTYASVETENTVAQKLFKGMDFNTVYRRLNHKVQNPYGRRNVGEVISLDVQWGELVRAMGFKERGGIVNLGYYPIKLTEHVFDHLKSRKRVLKLGSVIAVVENSHIVDFNGYAFIFNDHILNKVPLPTGREIVEVNPFYIEQNVSDLIRLLNNLASGEVMVWTHQGDLLASKLTVEGTLGALVLELYGKIKTQSRD